MPAPRYRPPAEEIDPARLLAAVGQFCEWLDPQLLPAHNHRLH